MTINEMQDEVIAEFGLPLFIKPNASGSSFGVTKVHTRDEVLPAMRSLREAADAMEVRMPANAWPFPSYGELLFSVK